MSEIDDLAESLKKYIEIETTRVDLDAKRIANEQALEGIETTRVANEQARVGVETTRIANHQAQANIETTRVANEQARIANEQSRIGLDTTRIANDKAIEENRTARVTNLRTQLSAAVPDISALPKNTVSFSEGRALRQAEATTIALQQASVAMAESIDEALRTNSIDVSAPIHISSSTDLVRPLLVYRRLYDEASLLQKELDGEAKAAKALLEPKPRERRDVGAEFAPAAPFAGADVGLAAAGALGTAITEVASLFEQDTAIQSLAYDVSVTTVHAAIAHELLQRLGTRKVRHETTRLPSLDKSPLLGLIRDLIDSDVELAKITKLLEVRIADLGDPEADATKAEQAKAAAEKKRDKDAEARADSDLASARERGERLAELKDAKAGIAAVLEKATAFATRVTTAPAAGEPSPLQTAIVVEPLHTDAGITGPLSAAADRLDSAAESAEGAAGGADLDDPARTKVVDLLRRTRESAKGAAKLAREMDRAQTVHEELVTARTDLEEWSKAATDKTAEDLRSAIAEVIRSTDAVLAEVPLPHTPPLVLAVTGASAESSQFVVTRRIFAPRLQTSVAVGFDYFLVQGDHLVAAGRATGDAAYYGHLKRGGAEWTRSTPLAEVKPQPAGDDKA